MSVHAAARNDYKAVGISWTGQGFSRKVVLICAYQMNKQQNLKAEIFIPSCLHAKIERQKQ